MWRYLLCYAFLCSCITKKTEKVNHTALVPTGSEIILERAPGQYHFPSNVQNVAEDSNQIALYDNRNDQILIYPIEGGASHSNIQLGIYKKDVRLPFTVVNSDKDWVSYNPSQRKGYNHDSTFLCLNENGVILDVFPFSRLPVPSQLGNQNKHSPKFYNRQTSSALIHDSVALIDLVSWDLAFGDSSFHAEDLTVGAFMNLKNRRVRIIKIRPAGKEGLFYPRHYKKAFRTIAHNGSLIYSFPHLNEMYCYNLRTSNVKQISTHSSLFDSIYPLNQNYRNTAVFNRPADDKSQFRYGELYYFPHQHVYLRVYQSPGTVDGQLISNPRFGYIVMDTTFNILGEGFLPPDYWFTRIHHKDGVVLYYGNNQSDSTIQFEIFSFKNTLISPSQLDSIRQSPQKLLNKGGMVAYLDEQHQWSKQNANVLFVPIGRICLSCQESVLDDYPSLTSRSNHLKLVLAAENKSVIDQVLDGAGLSNRRHEILIDKEAFYQNYFQDDLLGRLSIIRAGEVVKEYQLNPANSGRLKYLLEQHRL